MLSLQFRPRHNLMHVQRLDIAQSRAGRMRVFSAEFGHAWFIADGYLYDWLTALVIIVFDLIMTMKVLDPFTRFYLPGDPTLSYPHQADTISAPVLYVIFILFPISTFAIFAGFRRSLHDGHHGILSVVESFTVASAWKQWMNMVGVYRPNWLDSLASNDQAWIKDAHRSYPSGHSAYTFCTCSVLTLYLLGKLKVFSNNGKGQFAQALFCLLPIVLATFVAVSRIHDYKHAPADVNAGCFIGLVSGVFAYFLNYPSLLDPNSHLPRSRTWTTVGLNGVSTQYDIRSPTAYSAGNASRSKSWQDLPPSAVETAATV